MGRHAHEQVASLGTILGVWAHPDDEAYLSAGIMASATANGQRVACVTATRGEAGETADPDRWPPSELRDVRTEEMALSLAALGVTDHEWFDVPDGGCAEADPLSIRRLVSTIERVRPDTVLTFGPDGMTGHPDHRAVSGWVTEAFEGAAPPGTRLLHAVKSAVWSERFAELNEAVFPLPRGLPPSVPSEELAVCFRCEGPLLEVKLVALRAQASQTTGLMAALGDAEYAEWVSEEAFRLAAVAQAHP